MKKHIKLIIIFSLLVLFCGTAYAIWDFAFSGENNLIQKHDIEIEFLESSDVINITNAIPISDEEGMKQTETFDFQVRTKTKNETSIEYKINIEKLPVEEGYRAFNDDEIKIYLTDFKNNTIIEPTLISDLEDYELYKKYHAHDGVTEEVISKYKLRVWIDGEVTGEDWDQNTQMAYSFKLGAGSNDSANTYQVVFNSNNGNNETKIQHIGYDETLELEKNSFKNPGYVFLGWATSKNGEVVYQDMEEVTNLSGNSGTVTLYAKWIKSYAGYYVYNMVKDTAVIDNAPSEFVTGTNGIDFSEASGEENGLGVYLLSSTENEEYPTYYYRGEVTNNNIIFGEYCWKIVRTTETGGTKLFFNGIPVDGKCNNTGAASQLSSKIKYNDNGSLEYVGYSYGALHTLGAKSLSGVPNGAIFANNVTYKDGKYIFDESDIYTKTSDMSSNLSNILKTHHYTCFKTATEECTTMYFVYMLRGTSMNYISLHKGETIETAIYNGLTNSTNATSSNIKKYIDNWYEDKMTSYTHYLEDAVWCNDRSIRSADGWSINGEVLDVVEHKMNFSGYARNAVDQKPSLVCTNPADRFTVYKSNGNGNLKYPTALLTLDETALAGYLWGASSFNNYLNNDKIWWTMTPTLISVTTQYVGVVYSIMDNVHLSYLSNDAGGVRPAISLKYGITIKDGYGTKDQPFTIETINSN